METMKGNMIGPYVIAAIAICIAIAAFVLSLSRKREGFGKALGDSCSASNQCDSQVCGKTSKDGDNKCLFWTAACYPTNTIYSCLNP